MTEVCVTAVSDSNSLLRAYPGVTSGGIVCRSLRGLESGGVRGVFGPCGIVAFGVAGFGFTQSFHNCRPE